MERTEGVVGLENGSTSDGRPPNPLAANYKQYSISDPVAVPHKTSLVRHASFVSFSFLVMEFLFLTNVFQVSLFECIFWLCSVCFFLLLFCYELVILEQWF